MVMPFHDSDCQCMLCKELDLVTKLKVEKKIKEDIVRDIDGTPTSEDLEKWFDD